MGRGNGGNGDGETEIRVGQVKINVLGRGSLTSVTRSDAGWNIYPVSTLASKAMTILPLSSDKSKDLIT